MYNMNILLLMIVLIGIITLILRAIFLFYVPDFIERPLVKRGMEAVPASMLVALVIPFTLIENQTLSVYRSEVIAILISIPVILLTKKYAYGLVIAISVYAALILF